MRDWADLITDLLWVIERETKYTLRDIRKDFKRTGRSFDAKFRNKFLQIIQNRVAETYDWFEMKVHSQQVEIKYESDEMESDYSELARPSASENHRKSDTLARPCAVQKRQRPGGFNDSKKTPPTKRPRMNGEPNLCHENGGNSMAVNEAVNEDYSDAFNFDFNNADDDAHIEQQALSDCNHNSVEMTSENGVALGTHETSELPIANGVSSASMTTDDCQLQQKTDKIIEKNTNQIATESDEVPNHAIGVASNDTDAIETNGDSVEEIIDSDDDSAGEGRRVAEGVDDIPKQIASKAAVTVDDVSEKRSQSSTITTRSGRSRRVLVQHNQLEEETDQVNADQTAGQCEPIPNSSSAPVTVSIPAVDARAKDRPARPKRVRNDLPKVTAMPHQSNKANDGNSEKTVSGPIRLIIEGKTVFKCNQCKYISKRKDNTVKHILRHRPFKCDECTRSFNDKNELESHQKNHANRCSKCLKAFSADILKEHQQKCMVKQYECYACEYKTTQLYRLSMHMNKEHFGRKPSDGDSTKDIGAPIRLVENGKTSFKCTQCNFTSLDRRNTAAHIFMHKEKPFRCDKCRAFFSDKNELESHRKNHANRCPKCLRVISAEQLQEHQQKCGARQYECYACKYKTHNITNLIRHMKKHFGEQPKPFGCKLCPIKFSSQKEVLSHVLRAHCK